jgi:glycosyltransferase involved in cell wall biosynthesis
MTRVAIVAPSYSTYISTNHVLIAKGLVERGHEVLLVSTNAQNVRLRPYSPGEDRSARMLPFPVVHVPYLGVLFDNVVTLPSLRSLSGHFDAVLLQEDYPAICIETARWAFRRRIPVVISSERYYYPPAGLAKVALQVLDKTLHPQLWKRSSALTFHSHDSLDFFAGLGAPTGKLSFLPAGIDVDDFHTRNDHARESLPKRLDNRVELLCIARLHPYKGIETLVAAMSILRRQGVAVHLQIRGRGPLEGVLRSLISKSALDDHVSLVTSGIPNSEIPTLMASSDAYVQPSVREPFGSAVVEAMACQLPVVGSATGGLRDTIDDGRTGFQVPPLDPEPLARRISVLAGDPSLRSRMGVEALQRARKLFDYRVLSAKYEELVESITGGSPSGA